MGCGSSYTRKPTVTEDKCYDLMHIYLTWAKYTFALNGKYKSSYQIEIDDKRVVCESSEPVFGSRPEEIATTRVIYTGTQDIRNKEDEMKFRFKKEKKTKATGEIQMNKNLVRDGQGLDIRFPYPKLDSRSGFGSGTVLTGQVRQTEEHEMNWEVDAEIKASSPGKRKVDMSVIENHLDGDFTLQVAFRGPIKANLWDVSNGKKTLVSHVEGHAEDVLCDLAGFQRIHSNMNGKKWAAYDLKGSCHFRYAIEQHVVAHGVDDTENATEEISW